jgi:UDP-galactopyranose mutase
MRIAVIGAGLSGSTIARRMADAGHSIDLFEARETIAGNIHTFRDRETNVIRHTYGAHIFHTDNDRVWEWLNRFGDWERYEHHVYATVGQKVYSLPINLHTINQFFGYTFTPDAAKEFINRLADHSISEPKSFEDQALRFVGHELYETFFKQYTIKQWGRSPSEIPASVLARLPLRFNYNSAYFHHARQALPRHGYTPIVEEMLKHKNIEVQPCARISRGMEERYDYTFYTGPLDAWYDHAYGHLAYRTLDFVHEIHRGDAQGCPVMNYCGPEPYTRTIEHKHFAPWEEHDWTVVSREYSRECTPDDEPYYPIRLVHDKEMLGRYQEHVAKETRMTFIGRLAQYIYIDMDVAVKNALECADKFLT